MAKVYKCDPKHGFCETMRQRSLPANDNRTGLVAFVTVNLETRKTTLAGINHKLSGRDNGVLLNYCPYCGASLKPFLEPVLAK